MEEVLIMLRKLTILLATVVSGILKFTKGQGKLWWTWPFPEPFFTIFMVFILVFLSITSIFIPCVAPVLIIPIIMIAIILYKKRKFR